MKPEKTPFELLTGGRLPAAHKLLKKAGRASEKKKFTGLLSVPLRSNPPGLLDDGRTEKAYLKEIDSKLRLLLKHYDIASGKDQWFFLAFALAKDFCPGFEKPRVGAPKKWTDFALGCLVVELERASKVFGSNKAAAAELVKREPWKRALRDQGGVRAETLLTQFKKGRARPFTKSARKAYLWHEASGTVSEWDADVLQCMDSE